MNAEPKYAKVWSKEQCPMCDAAIKLLNENSYVTTVLKIGVGDTTVEHLRAEVPTAKSVPQIFINGSYVGGLTQLKTHLESKANATE